MPRRALLAGALAAAACGWLGCDSPIGHPPIARIVLTPESIPAHDNFQTLVTLDGSMSADPIDDPTGKEVLTYQWDIVDANNRFDMGSDDTSKTAMVRFEGERPATITLTVTDPDGNDASATKYLELSVTIAP